MTAALLALPPEGASRLVLRLARARDLDAVPLVVLDASGRIAGATRGFTSAWARDRGADGPGWAGGAADAVLGPSCRSLAALRLCPRRRLVAWTIGRPDGSGLAAAVFTPEAGRLQSALARTIVAAGAKAEEGAARAADALADLLARATFGLAQLPGVAPATPQPLLAQIAALGAAVRSWADEAAPDLMAGGAILLWACELLDACDAARLARSACDRIGRPEDADALAAVSLGAALRRAALRRLDDAA